MIKINNDTNVENKIHNEKTAFYQFPDEIILKIFSYLTDLKDYKNTSEVSHKFNAILMKSSDLLYSLLANVMRVSREKLISCYRKNTEIPLWFRVSHAYEKMIIVKKINQNIENEINQNIELFRSKDGFFWFINLIVSENRETEFNEKIKEFNLRLSKTYGMKHIQITQALNNYRKYNPYVSKESYWKYMKEQWKYMKEQFEPFNQTKFKHIEQELSNLLIGYPLIGEDIFKEQYKSI